MRELDTVLTAKYGPAKQREGSNMRSVQQLAQRGTNENIGGKLDTLLVRFSQ